MSSITVFRDLGDRPGTDIVDALLVSDRLKIARAKAEIDASTPVVPVSISLPIAGWIERGKICEIMDFEKQQYRGMIIGCKLVYEMSGNNEFSATTTLNITRLLADG